MQDYESYKSLLKYGNKIYSDQTNLTRMLKFTKLFSIVWLLAYKDLIPISLKEEVNDNESEDSDNEF